MIVIITTRTMIAYNNDHLHWESTIATCISETIVYFIGNRKRRLANEMCSAYSLLHYIHCLRRHNQNRPIPTTSFMCFHHLIPSKLVDGINGFFSFFSTAHFFKLLSSYLYTSNTYLYEIKKLYRNYGIGNPSKRPL